MHTKIFKDTKKMAIMSGHPKVIYECLRCKYQTLNELEWCPKCTHGLGEADV